MIGIIFLMVGPCDTTEKQGIGDLLMTIRKKGKQFQLISSTGKVLGTHPSRAKAQAQESAINISKAHAKGHKIPRKRT